VPPGSRATRSPAPLLWPGAGSDGCFSTSDTTPWSRAWIDATGLTSARWLAEAVAWLPGIGPVDRVELVDQVTQVPRPERGPGAVAGDQAGLYVRVTSWPWVPGLLTEFPEVSIASITPAAGLSPLQKGRVSPLRKFQGCCTCLLYGARPWTFKRHRVACSIGVELKLFDSVSGHLLPGLSPGLTALAAPAPQVQRQSGRWCR
jgi:hypothetical protein